MVGILLLAKACDVALRPARTGRPWGTPAFRLDIQRLGGERATVVRYEEGREMVVDDIVDVCRSYMRGRYGETGATLVKLTVLVRDWNAVVSFYIPRSLRKARITDPYPDGNSEDRNLSQKYIGKVERGRR